MKDYSFYFVRHGQTDANARKLMCGGGWDIPLNDEGLSQASKLANKLSDIDFKVDQIVASPMIRARQTAESLNQLLKRPLTLSERLREWCVGEWEKRPFNEVPNPFDTDEDPLEGETLEKFSERVLAGIKDSLIEFSGKRVLFVAHGAVAHVLFSGLGHAGGLIENCALYYCHYRDDGLSVERLL